MIEELYKMDDFKRALEVRQLDLTQLRLGEENTPLRGYRGSGFTRHRLILTIPDGNNILKYVLAENTFMYPIFDDEKKRMQELIDKATAKVKDELKVSEVVFGKWSA
jgi:hypothetical protein